MLVSIKRQLSTEMSHLHAHMDTLSQSFSTLTHELFKKKSRKVR